MHLVFSCDSYKDAPFQTADLYEDESAASLQANGVVLSAELNSHGMFNQVEFTIDTSESLNRYRILIIDDSLDFIMGIGSFRGSGDKYYDSLLISVHNEVENIIPIELYYNNVNRKLKYHWVNPKNDSINLAGGYPMLMDPKIMIGSLALDFTVTTYNGKLLTLSELKGRYVFLDFWGTWCIGCLDEIPHIMELRNQTAVDELFILGLAANDTYESLNLFFNERPINYPNALIGKKILEDYGILSFPTSFLIDKSGKVVARNLRGEGLVNKVKFLMTE